MPQVITLRNFDAMETIKPCKSCGNIPKPRIFKDPDGNEYLFELICHKTACDSYKGIIATSLEFAVNGWNSMNE